MSMASEVMRLIFAVLNVLFNGGHYTNNIKQHFWTINTTLHCTKFTFKMFILTLAVIERLVTVNVNNLCYVLDFVILS